MSGTKSTAWFWSDWMSEPGLRRSSYAARGLWMDMLCLAGMAEKIGYIEYDSAELAMMTGGTPVQVEALICELESHRVFSRNRRGVIYSRRMVNAEKTRAVAVKNGKKGGNPNLRKTKVNPGLVNQEANPADKAGVTPYGARPARLPSPSPSPSPKESSAAVADDDTVRVALAVEVGQKITDIMGVTDDPRWIGNWSQVQAWLNEGFNPAADIIPTVTGIVEKLKRSKRPMPSVLNYFTRAIREHHQTRTQGTNGTYHEIADAQGEFIEVKTGTPAFRAWIAFWKKQGRKTGWVERQRLITVPTEFPAEEAKA